MFKMFSFHTNSRAETCATLINCVIDDAFLETMPDIDQPQLQFIDVGNQLLHLSRISAVNWVQICAVGWPEVW